MQNSHCRAGILPVPCATQRCDFERYANRTMITPPGATNDDVPTPCGSDAYYCTGDGAKQLVPLGHKSTGPSLLRSAHTLRRRRVLQQGVGIPAQTLRIATTTLRRTKRRRAKMHARRPAKTTSLATAARAAACAWRVCPDGDDGGKLLAARPAALDDEGTRCELCALNSSRTSPAISAAPNASETIV